MEEVVAIDTNVLVTFLARRKEPEFAAAAQVLGNESVYIPPTVLLETEWVLRSVFRADRAAVVATLAEIVELPNVATEAWVTQALDWSAKGIEFADSMHLAASDRADVFFTNDRDFVKRGERLSTYPPFRSSHATDV